MLGLVSIVVSALSVAVSAAPLEERASSLTGSAVTLKLPAARGWSDDTDSVMPCGGISFNGTRTEYPLTGGQISLLVRADADRVQINYSKQPDPTKNSDFSMLVHEQSTTLYRGHHCLQSPSFTDLGFNAGDSVTLQVSYTAGVKDTMLYQCADITLVDPSAYVAPTGQNGCFTGALEVATLDTNDYSDSTERSGLPGGAIAGAVVGSISGAAVIVALTLFLRRKKSIASRGAGAQQGDASYFDGHTLAGDGNSFAEMQQKAVAASHQ